MEPLAEYVDGLPNLCGQEPLISEAIAAGREYPVFPRDGDLERAASTFAVALHMHQPLIPADDGDLEASLGVGLQVLGVVGVPELLQQVRPLDGDRIRLHPLSDQPVTLLQANPHLLGQVVLPAVGGHRGITWLSHASKASD